MNVEDLESSLREALSAGYRNSLFAKGQGRSMIMRDGLLPDGHPHYPKNLSYNLLSYGYSLFSQAIYLCDVDGDRNLARRAFEQAGNAIEAVVSNDDRKHPDYGFHIVMAASAFHLGRFSARAFSVLGLLGEEANISPIENALSLLMRRSLADLEQSIMTWCSFDAYSDASLLSFLESRFEEVNEKSEDEGPHIEAIDLALTESFLASLGSFFMALETGDVSLYEAATRKIKVGLEITSELNMVPQWWSFRIATKLLTDLWETSFHIALPKDLPMRAQRWNDLRRLFIASMYKRKKSEVELWPSQLEAAKRSVDINDNLVASLPTSAGKTRIAELAILRCLADDKRVIFITPLRALSAQTETGLQTTFGPLGYKISTLYGSVGSSNYENDAIRESEIVVATPEKIDFALRNDPGILDDVGLIVLDEGHMIGLSEREIRYEAQIQRLLKRPDAHLRRIVCLSAILPEGDQFDDFVDWLRRDDEGDAIVSNWRPTRVRYGQVLWQSGRDRAWLELKIEDERSFVPEFFSSVSPSIGTRKKNFPTDQQELVLATAWRLIEDGHSVLIFCPLKKSVEPYAKKVFQLYKQGFVSPLIAENADEIKTALTTGMEWLGEGHPILECLKLGVAIHHGSLPTPFRREVEKLLRKGFLKVTVSSPTLAQGLNLSATSVLFHSLFRNRELIPSSEFKNVIGRAGRAFVDVEGLVLYPMFEPSDNRERQWAQLINDAGTLSMESGLVRLVMSLLLRMRAALGGSASLDELLEYVVNNAEAWNFPSVAGEQEESRLQAQSSWHRHINFLDTSLLSLVGENDVALVDLSNQLDAVLSSSLWERRLNRRNEEVKDLCEAVIKTRSKFVWENTNSSQRMGYFLAGVGLTTGQQLDAVSVQVNELLVSANGAIINGKHTAAIDAITALAGILFAIPPFKPSDMPDDWKNLLAGWLNGQKISDIAAEASSKTLNFIEDAFVYRLPWGIESVKVRAVANGDRVGDFSMEDFELSLAVPALETGTLNVSAAILMQSGFTARLAAIHAVTSADATFTGAAELRGWLSTDHVKELGESGTWPTQETSFIWTEFVSNYSRSSQTVWKTQKFEGTADWNEGARPDAGDYIKLIVDGDGSNTLLSSEFSPLGKLRERFPENLPGLLISQVNADVSKIDFTYYGPELN